MSIRIGVLGVGVIGRLRAATVQSNPGTTLAAVFDIDRGLAETAAAGSQAKVTTSIDEFFAVPMDAVIISSPIHFHEEQCVRAFSLGLHVLVEKPLSNTIESCGAACNASAVTSSPKAGTRCSPGSPTPTPRRPAPSPSATSSVPTRLPAPPAPRGPTHLRRHASGWPAGTR